VKTNSFAFSSAWGLSIASVSALTINTHFLIETAAASSSSCVALAEDDFGNDPEFQQWWNDVWGMPYDHNMFLILGSQVADDVWDLALVEQVDDGKGSVNHLSWGTVTKLWQLPLDTTQHEPFDVTFVVNNPISCHGEPDTIEVAGTIQLETQQWAATIVGANNTVAPVIVSADIFHLTYSTTLPSESVVLLFPIREFDSMNELDEFMAIINEVTQLSGGGGTPGDDCDPNDIFCIACAPLDNCQQLAYNTYRLDVADCSSLPGVGIPVAFVTTGAAIGAVGGPKGAAIGAGIGLISGLVAGSVWTKRDCLRRAMRTYEANSDLCWMQHDPFPNEPNETHPCIERWLHE
jgi:hypothetical protein